jgi:hypothetical protein
MGDNNAVDSSVRFFRLEWGLKLKGVPHAALRIQV